MTEEREQAALNTDRELWRERADDYYANSIHVTAKGGIGINVGGLVVVRSLKDWHAAAFADRQPVTQETLAAYESGREVEGPAPEQHARQVLASFGIIGSKHLSTIVQAMLVFHLQRRAALASSPSPAGGE